MKPYSGICLGGPLNGRQLTWDRPYYQKAIMPPMDFTFPTEISDEKLTYEFVTYSFARADILGRIYHLWLLTHETRQEHESHIIHWLDR